MDLRRHDGTRRYTDRARRAGGRRRCRRDRITFQRAAYVHVRARTPWRVRALERGSVDALVGREPALRASIERVVTARVRETAAARATPVPADERIVAEKVIGRTARREMRAWRSIGHRAGRSAAQLLRCTAVQLYRYCSMHTNSDR
jgi:hypothetical protein